ncbi:hypothetical protein WMF04_25905 [Sorangium sp. So ce260]|uniref:hypothetical protein n=1 Tax=Sorangium sp. So ce260 TaxID=3133291 RepID=UPI003F600E12
MTSPKDRPRRLPLWADPVPGSIAPETRKEQLAQAQARRLMMAHGVEDPDVESALVKMAAWVEKLVAAELAAEQEETEAWVTAVPAESGADRRRSRLALLGAVIFVLSVLCGVALAALRSR